MKKKIYALLVGITDYDRRIALDNGIVAFPALYGCVNDALKIKAFLTDTYGSDVELLELYNTKATKDRIVEAFCQHLGQAGATDSVFFYFSGHGTQEHAHDCFSTETDGKLESLVAWYDNKTFNNCLIADKELRYLISGITAKGPHCTVIIDSCHSGDATRAVEILDANFGNTVPKNFGTYTFSQRDWSNFIFSDSFTSEDIKKKGVDALLPEGDHILFSAAQSHQPALEVNGEGCFTRQLFNILVTTKGYISNQMLFDRLSIYMKYTYVQVPRLYTTGKAHAWRTGSFLNALELHAGSSAAAWYTPARQWLLNRGEINGIHMGLDGIGLKDRNGKKIRAGIKQVMIDFTVLSMPDDIDNEATYIADVAHLDRQPVKLYQALNNVQPKDAELLFSALGKLDPAEMTPVMSESEADYTLQHMNGFYYLTSKEDRFRPLSELIPCDSPQNITSQVKHLAAWKFIHSLNINSGEISSAKPLHIEYSINNAEYGTLNYDGEEAEIIFDQWKGSGKLLSTNMNMRLTNTSAQDLYVAVLYMDLNFSCETFLLEPSPVRIEARSSVDLNVAGDKNIRINLDSQATNYNYESYKERIKIIVSDRPFEIQSLKLEALPAPPGFGGTHMKGIIRGGIDRPKAYEGWFTISIDLISINPLFNVIAAQDLEKMLDYKLFAPFAEGIFFTQASGEREGPEEASCFGTRKLKPGIKVTRENIDAAQ